MCRGLHLVLFQVLSHLGDVVVQAHLADLFPLGQLFLHLLQNGQQVVLGLQVVHAVHQQQVGGEGYVLELLVHQLQQPQGVLNLRREALGVVIPEFHVDGQRLGAVGPPPEEFALGGQAPALFIIEAVAPAEHHAADAEIL